MSAQEGQSSHAADIAGRPSLTQSCQSAVWFAVSHNAAFPTTLW